MQRNKLPGLISGMVTCDKEINDMKDKYDVAVYGLWYGNNYGSIITYYALTRVLESLNYTYAMIRNPLGREIDIDALNRSHPLKFARDRYEVTPLLPINRLSELNNNFSAFVLGSDQMWNYNLSRPYGQSYFFDFVADDKVKIAYATSFGKDKYIGPEDEKIRTDRNLHRFDGISVRDDFSQRICKDEFGISAELLSDPVFLCPVEKYNELIAEASDFKVEGDYIFAYILDPNEKIGASIQKIAEETQKKVIVVFNESGDKESFKERLKISSELVSYELDPTVNEWLYLYKNSQYVLTDSFHGTCFSIIFQKPFVVMKNVGRGGARFPFLLGELGLLDRMIEKPEDFVSKFNEAGFNVNIDYTSVNEVILEKRKESIAWLKNHLDKALYNSRTVNKVVDEKNCSGCGACQEVCPKDAINLKYNNEGFLVPEIDSEKCVKCGICLKKCTSENPVYKNEAKPKCYAMMASDEIREISSSGGMFTVAAKYVIEQGGYVAGAAYEQDYKVEHIIINNIGDLWRLRGSKYMQSYAAKVYPEIKKLLKDGKMVLFTGMPCQVAGLYSYLGQEYANLYTIDLLCHGITSSKVFEKYHNDVLGAKKLNRLEFKQKTPWGWHAGINAYFTDGTTYQKPLESDMYFIAYLKSISKNTTCGKCVSNKLPRQGDLTIGDFWGIPKYDEEMSDLKGTSVVLVNNKKAEEFFEKLKSGMKKVREEPLEVAIRGNHIIKGPYRLHKNREEFFEYFDRMDFTSLTKGCYYNQIYKYYKQELDKKLPENYHEYYYLAEAAARYSNGRKIVTWIQSRKFEEILKKYFGLEVAFSIAKSETKVDNEKVFPVSKIKDGSSDFYIVAFDPKNAADTYALLEQYGYNNLQDFICRYHKPIVINEFDLSKGRYSDAYGNTIEGYTGIIKKIVFRGCNNHIIIGDKVTGSSNMSFDLLAGTYIEIEKECRFNGENRFITKSYSGKSEVIIRRGCRLTNALYRILSAGQILINEECTFETNLELHANAGKKIIIGRDSIFSHDIDLWAGDGHTIFDVLTGKNINSALEKQPSHRNAIIIGEHVWVGKGAFIMHGTNIGNGSIVGAKSVVKGQFPNNCSIGGNPAKIVRRDCAWARDIVTEDIKKCGRDEYFMKTSADNNTADVHKKNENSANQHREIENFEYPDEKIERKKIQNWLVTGGSSGLGKALVLRLIELGYKVAATSRDITKLEQLPDEVIKIQLDVRSLESCREAVNKAEEQMGTVDVLVNNAGLSHISTFEETPNEIADSIIETNYWGVSNMAKAIIPHMRKNKNGTMINISSASGFRQRNYGSYYVASKFAVESLTKSLKFECQKFMRVTAIEFGGLNTGLNKRQTVIHSKLDEYKQLPPLFPYKKGYSNKLDRAVEAVIKIANKKEMPRDLILGWDAYQQFPKAISFFEDEVEKYKPISITTDENKKDSIKLEDIVKPRNPDLKIQNWLITGASGGVGKILALRLNELGYSVTVTSRDISKMKTFPKEIYVIESPLDSAEECAKVVKAAVHKMGSIDVLVNNATCNCWCSFEECKEDIMRNVFYTNYILPQYMIKAALPYMRQSHNGTVVNLVSIAAIQPRARVSTYSAAKAGLEGLTRTLKAECHRFARFMAVELVCMKTGIMVHNPVIDTQIPEYQGLGRYTPEINNIPNRKDIAVQQLINVVNQEELPQSLLIGTESYLIAKNEIERAKKEFEEYKDATLSICEKQK